MKNFIKGVNKSSTRMLGMVLVIGLLISGGVLIYQTVFAVSGVSVTPASGGTVSIDTTSNADCVGTSCGTSVELSGPSIAEGEPGNITEGSHTIVLPTGWEFNPDSTVKVVRTAGNILPASQDAVLTANTLTFTISQASTNISSLAFIINSMQVVPTGKIVTTGDITYTGVGIEGVTDETTSFGTLSTIAGTVTQVAFTTQPGDAVYGSLLSSQPVLKTQDQFGNDSTNGLAENLNVTLTKTVGSGDLLGTAVLDIGAGNGTVSFTGLTVNAVGTKQLTAEATGLESDVSNDFEITSKTLTATITAGSKTYDGDNSATFTNPTPVGVEFSDVLALSGGSATFADADVGTGKVVTATGLVLTGGNAANYTYDNTALGSADINPLVITVTPDADQTKVYGNIDPTFAYTFDPALIIPDIFSGALSRDGGEDVNTYNYTLGDLTAGSNYSLTLSSETFGITKRPLTVTATGVNREYDTTTVATVTLSDNRVPEDDLTFEYTAVFTDKNVNTGITVNISAISITGGADVGNYTLGSVPANTTANITSAPLTVSFTTHANKTYNGDNSADIKRDSTLTLAGVLNSEAVNITTGSGSATFADKNIGNTKTVTATGFTLDGDDEGNYVIGYC